MLHNTPLINHLHIKNRKILFAPQLNRYNESNGKEVEESSRESESVLVFLVVSVLESGPEQKLLNGKNEQLHCTA